MAFALTDTFIRGQAAYQPLNRNFEAIRDYMNNSLFLASEVVTVAAANKVLKLDANSKLPASITGNCDGTAAKATYLAGGLIGQIPYQSAANVTAFLASIAGDSGKLLQSGGAGAPSWIQATDGDIASTIVKRDASKNFSAGTITANLTGNATGLAMTANVNAGNYQLRALQFYADAATGTAPFVVDSITEVANLRAATATTADKMDGVRVRGYLSADAVVASTAVVPFESESFDPKNKYNTTTYRCIPGVGTYLVHCTLSANDAAWVLIPVVRVNGTEVATGTIGSRGSVVTLVNLTTGTDYIDFVVYWSSGGTTIDGNASAHISYFDIVQIA